MPTTNNNFVFYLFNRLTPFLLPYRFWIVVKLLCTILSAINDIFMVYVINIMVNVSLSADKWALLQSVYLMIASVLVGIGISFLNVYSSGRYSVCVARDIKDAISEHIDKLPISYIESRHSGDFTSRMTNGINSIEQFLNNNFTEVLFHIIRIAVCISCMFYMNWQLTLFCFLMILLMTVLTIFISQPLSQNSVEIQRGMDRTNAAVQDTISGIHVVKSYNLAQVLLNKFKILLDQILRTSIHTEKTIAFLGMVSVFVSMVPFVVFFLFGGYLVNEGLLSIGALLAFAQFINYLTTGLRELPNGFGNIKMTAGVMKHLSEILDEKTERTDGSQPKNWFSTVPALEFDNVSFSYNDSIKVLKNINFTLPQGKTIAIVGSSGSGKSTISKLIAGFYNYQNGTILLFNEPLSNWKLSASRSMISLVSQDTFLFPISIFENITCSNSNYSMEDVERAAKMANIHEFIQSLPDGYHTFVGERGVKLSGGQRQRIAIARAILKDAPILLLDEATSALDTESEQLVQEAINRIMKDKTVLIVAHRLSTVIKADQILVLNDGQIVERGTHEELLAQNGVYSRLYNNQMSKRDGVFVSSSYRGGVIGGLQQ